MRKGGRVTDDRQIISMMEQRDESALEQIREKYSAYLTRIAKNVLGNDADAEECVNETLFRIWQKIPPADPPNFPLFIGKIARELAIDTFRAKLTKKRRGSEYEASLNELGDLIPSDDGTSDLIDGILLRDKISEFLRLVPEQKRKIFIRRYFLFDPVKTIARSYGVSESYVKVNLYRTRTKLKEYLEKEGFTV